MASKARTATCGLLQGRRKGPVSIATDYPFVDELLTIPSFEVADRADEACADVLVSLRPVRDFYRLPRSVCVSLAG